MQALLLTSPEANPFTVCSHNDADGAGGFHVNEKNSGGGKTLGRRGDVGLEDAETKLDVERDPQDLMQQSSALSLWLEISPEYKSSRSSTSIIMEDKLPGTTN
jgi:hypothetical protein